MNRAERRHPGPFDELAPWRADPSQWGEGLRETPMGGHRCWCGAPTVAEWLTVRDQDGAFAGAYPVCGEHGRLASWSVELKLSMALAIADAGDQYWEDAEGTQLYAGVVG